MPKPLMSLLVALAAVSTCLGAPTATGRQAGTTNPVVQWNRNLLAIVRTPGAQPGTVHPTRSFAILHAAIYDAVNSIEKTHQSYAVQLADVSPTASVDAAAVSAAHEALVALYPSFQATLDSEYQQSLALIPAGPDRDAGVSVGQTVADQIVALRGSDGSATVPPPFTFGNAPGNFQSPPPNLPKPAFTIWSQVTPFVLQSADQFRPGPPPALTSTAYSDAVSEIQAIGILRGTQATRDQQLTGWFWNGPIQNYWNEITQTAALTKNLTTGQSARLFALLNLTFADAVIAFYDAKYTYQLWRPVSAIRGADTDGNPATTADPNWLPLVRNSPADPSYPGAHAVISGAAQTVLDFFFGSDQFDFAVTSEVFAGTQRSFASFTAAANEAALSRVYAGVHFRFDETVGLQMGQNIAGFVTTTRLLPTP